MILICGVIQEVSAAERLRAENTRLSAINQSLLDIAGGSFWRTDPEGRLLDLAGWMQFTGKSAEQLGDYDKLPAVHPMIEKSIAKPAKALPPAARSSFPHASCAMTRLSEVPQPHRPDLDPKGNITEWHGLSWTALRRAGAGDKPPRRFEARCRHFRAARALLDLSPRRNWRTCPSLFLHRAAIGSRRHLGQTGKRREVKKALQAKGIRSRPHARRTYHCRVGLGRLEPCSRRSSLELKYPYCGARAALPAQGPPQRQALASHQGGAPHPYLRRLRKPPPRSDTRS